MCTYTGLQEYHYQWIKLVLSSIHNRRSRGKGELTVHKAYDLLTYSW